MAEWIVEITDGVPHTRKMTPLVRCKDCKWLSMTTLGMDYACWHGAYTIFGETGEHADHHVCRRIESPDWFCADGERREDGNTTGSD